MLKRTFHNVLINASSFLQRQWLSTASAGGSGSISNSTSTACSHAPNPGGLFGIARLQRPADFPLWAEDAIACCNELVSDVLAAPADARVVRLVDDISDEMCQVFDSAECCRNIHSNGDWRQAAGKACQGLYNKLVAVEEAYRRTTSAATAAEVAPAELQLTQQLLSPGQLAEFCPETVVVTHKYRQEFEKFGIHLTDNQQRSEVARLLALNQHYPALFNAALADRRQLGTAAVPAKHVPGSLQQRGPFLASKMDVPLDSATVHHFLAYCANEDARKKVYMAAAATPASNLLLLDDMLACRKQLAELLGFPSYAAFKAADATLAGAVLQPWDQDFYTRLMAAGRSGSHAGAAAAPYLKLASVLAGLDEMLQQLMGLSLQEQKVAASEAWAPGVLKYQVVCQDQGVLGTLYLDLLWRPGKVPSSGILYPVRCGRELPGNRYQQPILCLVGNMGERGNHNYITPQEVTLTWHDFKTLLHEMGHAVHSMVSRTRYQHVWGTRCSQDVVEVPSHLWEHFATAGASRALLTRHHISRQPMPESIAQDLASQGSITPALDLQHQALLSLVDMMYHGPQPPAGLHNTSGLWLQVAKEHSSLPPPAGTCPQARFGHLTIYGASYHSYLYAKCLAEAIWHMHLATDPLNFQT
eukprot:gene12131-12269_t